MNKVTKLTGYGLSRAWFNYLFEHPDKLKHVHTALFFFIVDSWNRFGQKEKIRLPTRNTMEILGITSRKTFYRTLQDLEDLGFIKTIEESLNQSQCRVISINPACVKYEEPGLQALDQANIQATPKHDIHKQTKEKQNNLSTDGDSMDQGNPCIDILKYYQEKCQKLPEVKELTAQREKEIKARLKDTGINEIKKAFDLAAGSRFLNGGNDRGWKADLDWILKHDNIVKVLEEKYENKGLQLPVYYSNSLPDNPESYPCWEKAEDGYYLRHKKFRTPIKVKEENMFKKEKEVING